MGQRPVRLIHVRTAAVIHEAVGHAERVVDAARTEAPLFGEIGFEVSQQFGAGDLSGSRCNRLDNAYLDQVRGELAA